MKIYTVVTKDPDRKATCCYVVANTFLDKHIAHIIHEAAKDENVVRVLVLEGEWFADSISSILVTLPSALVFSWDRDEDIPCYHLR